MTHLPPDDSQWQEFLHKHCPTPPPPAADLEDRLMKSINKSQPPVLTQRLWAVPPALAAGLLMAWSGYRLLMPLPELSNSASLEAFLQDNWNNVVGEKPASSQSNTAQADWILLANTAQ